MSIVKKLDQILTHIDGVLSADREQNVKILIRQIKDELASNNDKTMGDLLNVIKPKRYVIYYYDVQGWKFYWTNLSGSSRNIKDAGAYDSIESVSNAINKFSLIYPFQFKIEQVKQSIGFSDFNDFHENC
jgi:hypothetical protein